ncbi:ATP-dependent Clp protease ATP-binding subunit ClpA [Kitasatospora sp. MAP12-15]|uniref:Clp protease N-terminal domain-containing protein n=1 Tax=unclassified Kitasatospora TaxID=2633591 RepID=UPI0024736B12|nr:Clp protease N-terminal domain-containing protein [Kitasatospora sp. MAP12-44]MDH6114067.1 ATP-dependent Clp protease ATP-binding subunit ClpA [Kitasatospora sp. MAP12-44]
MLERFSDDARRAIPLALTEADRLGHTHVGTEHLLLALLHLTDDPAVDVLIRSGLDLETARAAVVRLLAAGPSAVDAEALGAIGIDLAAVREAVEAAFGPGALDGPGDTAGEPRRGSRLPRVGGRKPWTRPAKKVLELAVRETTALGGRTIRPGHLVLGLLKEGDGVAARVLHQHGLDFTAVRAAVLPALR